MLPGATSGSHEQRTIGDPANVKPGPRSGNALNNGFAMASLVGLIAAHPVLNRYFEYFKECLSKPDTRVTVIGYGFADDHINDDLLEAGRGGNMMMFVVRPRGRAILVRDHEAVIPPPEPLRDDIGSLGESTKRLSRTFRDDEFERDALYAVLK